MYVRTDCIAWPGTLEPNRPRQGKGAEVLCVLAYPIAWTWLLALVPLCGYCENTTSFPDAVPGLFSSGTYHSIQDGTIGN